MKANFKLMILSITIILLTITPIAVVKADEITLNIPADKKLPSAPAAAQK